MAGAAVSAMMQGAIPVIMMALMDSVGWRGTYVWLGLATLLIMVPLGGIFFRSKPEVYGLLPDGESSQGGGDSGSVEMVLEPHAEGRDVHPEGKQPLSPVDETVAPDDRGGDGDPESDSTSLETNWEARQVFKSPAFWAFALPDLVIAGTGTAFWFHLRAAFVDMGVSAVVLRT